MSLHMSYGGPLLGPRIIQMGVSLACNWKWSDNLTPVLHTCVAAAVCSLAGAQRGMLKKWVGDFSPKTCVMCSREHTTCRNCCQLYSFPTLLVGTAYVVCIVMIHVHVLLMRRRPFCTAAVPSQQLMSVWVVAISGAFAVGVVAASRWTPWLVVGQS